MKESIEQKKAIRPTPIRVGDIYNTKSCGPVEIVEYIDAQNIIIRFVGYDHKAKTRSYCVRTGSVKNLLMPNVKGVGYIGYGKYSWKTHKKIYATWNSMIERCYCPKYQMKKPTYINCSVCPEWHNFQNFAKWFEEDSMYKEGYQLDKDIKVQGNKVYSAETCVFVSAAVNSLLTAHDAKRGIYMLGVSKNKQGTKFIATCNGNSKSSAYIGLYETEIEAHEAYKKVKYDVILKAANKQENFYIKEYLLAYKIPKH